MSNINAITADDIQTVTIDGRLMWVFPNGRTHPVIRGGSEDDGGGTDGDGGGDDANNGDGTQTPSLEETVKRLEAESAKWKGIALKHEQKAKDAADAQAKLQELELAGKSETEKLQALLAQAQADARSQRVAALKLQVAADKGLDAKLAKFLPDVDDEIDMMTAADELLEAAGGGTGAQPTRQPKSNLLTPLQDGDPDTSRDQLLAAMQGKSAL